MWQPGFVGFLYMVWLFRLGNGALHLGDEPIPDAPVSGFESDLGSTAGKWLGALVGFLFMVLVGALLGSIVSTPDLVPQVADAVNKTAKVMDSWQRSAVDLQ